MAANAGKYSEAESYSSAEIKEAMKGGLGALSGSMKEMWDYITRDGTIQRIEILQDRYSRRGSQGGVSNPLQRRYDSGCRRATDQREWEVENHAQMRPAPVHPDARDVSIKYLLNAKYKNLDTKTKR